MKYTPTALLVLAASVSLNWPTLAEAAPPIASPAEQAIARAQKLIVQKPDFFDYYNALALAPDNYEGLKVQTWLQLGRHEFAKALVSAQKLNQKTPDDVIVYGYLADANAELGRYDAAEKAAQWMLNLRPGNVPGLTRGAYLRELFGDLDGAAEFMKLAYDATPYGEIEDRAWILTQMGHIYLQEGDLKRAEMHLTGALSVFPNYHYALGTLGQIRMAQKRYDEAAQLFAERYAKAPHAENLYDWAKTLECAGKHEEAKAKFALFEQRSLAESTLTDNSNHELVLYYVDDVKTPEIALRIAQLEYSRRHDVHKLDCLAWALHANHDDRQAKARINEALVVGVKDPAILQHAETIYLASGDLTKGKALLEDAARHLSLEAMSY